MRDNVCLFYGHEVSDRVYMPDRF
jgi:hypothetical protein